MDTWSVIIDIDNIEVNNTYQYVLYYTKPTTGLATSTISAGSVASVSITDSGDGYRETFPDLTFSSPDSGTTATGTAQTQSGKITTLTITNPGSGYTSAPTVSIEAPQGVDFDRGEKIVQTFASGVKMSAEVVMQKDSDGAVYVTHVGADDGKFHTFVAGRDIIGQTTNAISTLKSTSELNNMTNTEDNSDFDDVGADFIDFSENNPFGDPD